MLYSCALVFFLCAASCFTTIGLFSDRWMLVEASVRRQQQLTWPAISHPGDNATAAAFVAMGLWETRRVPFYHYYYRHQAHAVLVYHDIDLAAETHHRRSSEATTSEVAIETPDAPSNSSGIRANWRPGSADRPAVSEATLKRLAATHCGALVAVRVLLFATLALCLGAFVKLVIDACNDRSVIRHRYKDRSLAYTLAILCGFAFLLSVTAWSVFLGTLYSAVISQGETSEVLNSGFICSVLASLTAIVAAIMAACSITTDE